MNESASKEAVIVTSISTPNSVMSILAMECSRRNWRFYVIGDVASPDNFTLAGCDFFGLERQKTSGLKLATECPLRHYARKNVGYLLAIRERAEVIIETDDDNFPLDGFWDRRQLLHEVPVLSHAGWANVYQYFTEDRVWPRGLPLNFVQHQLPPYERCEIHKVECPIQQGLAQGNPDVDAIYRLTRPLPLNFKLQRKVALSRDTWCPFNSQNTTFFPEAYALLYLPAYCSFRMTDIWRSFIAQRILWENDWMVMFHEATVFQERNEHSLMKDFEDEIPGYLHNQRIGEILSAVSLRRGPEEMGYNLLQCYEALVRGEIFPEKELRLVEIWLADLAAVSRYS